MFENDFKIIIDVTVTIVRAFEIHRLTGASVGFGKIYYPQLTIFHSNSNREGYTRFFYV